MAPLGYDLLSKKPEIRLGVALSKRLLLKRHKLRILSHLLGMAQLETEERLRLRSKRRVS
jgi:hypothetical protein